MLRKSNMPRKEEMGFTMVELLVTLVLTGVVMAAVYTSFASQQKVYLAQDDVAAMQQDLRAAMDVMVSEIRMAGYDPNATGNFNFISMPAADDPNYGRYTSSDGIAFYEDADSTGTSGVVDPTGLEQIAFRLNVDQTGAALATPDNVLRKYSPETAAAGTPWQPLATNVEAIGFAYAYDNDGDGKLDTWPGTNAIIWAINDGTSPVGTLNKNLDTNNDGQVDLADNSAGVAIATPVDISKIRAVKIWVLERSQHQDKDFVDNNTYVVANQRIPPTPSNNKYRRRLLTATVWCRNMGTIK